MRQLRLRDIGGIIVIDFIDMANPKNRATVEEALRTELERDRTKTYVVEISPLGLVEMTRQNVTDGPREILTKKCPTCAGDGIVVSEASAAVEVERRLRALAAGSRAQAFQVEVNAKIASLLLGPGGSRLAELEEATKRRFFLAAKEDVHLDHFRRARARASSSSSQPPAPVAEGAELELKLVEVGLHDAERRRRQARRLRRRRRRRREARRQEGRRCAIERVLDGVAYATRARTASRRRPSRSRPRARPRSRRARRAAPRRRRRRSEAEVEAEAELEADGAGGRGEPEAGDAEPEPEDEAAEATEAVADGRRGRAGEEEDAPRLARRPQPEEEAGRGDRRRRACRGAPRRRPPSRGVRRRDAAHPRARRRARRRAEAGAGSGRRSRSRAAEEGDGEPAEPDAEAVADETDGAEATPPKKKTRRGSRGGRNREEAGRRGDGGRARRRAGRRATPEPQAEAVDERRRSGGGRLRADVGMARRAWTAVARYTSPRSRAPARVFLRL